MTSPAFDLIGLTQLRNDPRYREIDGGIDKEKNLAVVVIDTGIQGDHPLLDDNFKAYVNFTGDASPVGEVITNANESFDGMGHGTHVAGTIGSEDESIGVATGVDLISLQVFSRNPSKASKGDQNIVKALEWILDNQNQYNIVAVNMSLGEGFYTLSNQSNSDYIDIINQLEQAGITVVSAAGNNYAEPFEPEQNVMSPAIFSTLAVGAVYQDYYPANFSNRVEQDEITESSQRLQFDRMIFAPGAYINSTVPGNRTKSLPGTSMASPMVAGAVALLQEAALQFGDRKLTPYEVRKILLQTADEIIDGDTEDFNPTGETFLRMNVYKAVQEVERRLNSVTPGTNPNPDPNPTDPNGIISRAISLGSDNNIVLEQLTELTTVARDSIGNDEGTDEGTIEVGDTDVDFFSFNVPDAGGLVIIQTNINDKKNQVDTILRLFDARGDQIDIDDDSGDEQFSRIEAILEAGQYFAGVSGYNNINYNPTVANSGIFGETGSYSLQLQFKSGITTVEQNGTITDSVALDNLVFDELEVQYVDLSIGSDPIADLPDTIAVGREDVDMFRFDVDTPGLMVLQTFKNDPDDRLDSVLRLFDASGNQLDFNDDVGEDFFSRIATELNPGTYYVGVSGYDNSNYNADSLSGRVGGSTGTATLKFLFQPSGNTDTNGIKAGAELIELTPETTTEHSINNLGNRSTEDTGGSDDENGTIKEATQFNLGGFINGNIGSDSDSSTNVGADDVDFYKINSAQGGLLDINIDAFEGTDFEDPVDSMVFLFDEQGNQLDFNDDSPFSKDSELQYFIDADRDYYVAVAGYGNFYFDPNIAGSDLKGSTGDYTLHARVLQPKETNSDNIATAFKNALNREGGSFSLDVDREIFGPNLSQIKTNELNYLELGTSVTASLGKDVIGSANSGNSNRQFSSFSTLYRTEVSPANASDFFKRGTNSSNASRAFLHRSYITQVSPQIFGIPLNNSFNSGADDVDYFPIHIDSRGRYDLQTLGTGLGTGGANTTLRLYDYGGKQISDSENTVSLPGTDERVLVSVDKPGDYWIAVLPEAEATQRFDFQSHSFGTNPLTDEEIEQFKRSNGEYRLLANRFTLQAITTPGLRDGAISIEFNDVLNLDRLSLYDGSDAETLDLSSLTVVDSNGNPVRGSLIVENNKVIFVPTNPLDAGTYTLTYNSNDFITQFGSENTQFQSQEMLDGDRGGTGGDNLITNISVTDINDVLLTVPSFARGSGQAVDIGGAGAGLPISVSNAEGFTDIRLRLKYNAELLSITNIVLADGLPGDWQRTGLEISDGQVIIDLAGTTALEAGATDLVKLVARVPENAAFNNSQVLRVSGGAIDGDRNPIGLEESAAVHQVAFLGDANGDGIIDFGDVLAIANIRSSDDISGFDRFDLTDPVVIGDVNRDNIINLEDVSAVAREFLDDSSLIPSANNTLIPEAPIGPIQKLLFPPQPHNLVKPYPLQ